MKRIAAIATVGVFLMVCFASVALSATEQDAKAMVTKAVAFYKAHGKDKTIEETKNPKGQFLKGDAYLNIFSLEGVMLANPVNVKLIGSSLTTAIDADQKPFGKEMIELAKTKGSGWVEYKWSNPVSKKIEHKISYVQKVDDIFFVCGAYKK